jgi:hypothetical protein
MNYAEAVDAPGEVISLAPETRAERQLPGAANPILSSIPRGLSFERLGGSVL